MCSILPILQPALPHKSTEKTFIRANALIKKKKKMCSSEKKNSVYAGTLDFGADLPEGMNKPGFADHRTAHFGGPFLCNLGDD